MKKIVTFIIMFFAIFSLIGCDTSHLCSFDILCSNENISVIVEGESYNSFTFSSNDFNMQPKDRYSFIDFMTDENKNSNAKMHKFEITSLVDETYNLSLKLVDANKYVVDF